MNSTINLMYCGLHSNISVKWKKYFHDVHFGMNYYTVRCLFSELIPTGAIILFNSYIVYHIILTRHHLRRASCEKSRPRQSRTASWMNIVLILHSFLFLGSLSSHIAGHFTIVETHETWWILLAILINCSINFYVYCLSGKAFRNEIHRFLHRFKTRIFNRLQTRQQQSCQDQRLIHEMSDVHRRSQL
jgi:hypothetical protein